MASRTSRIALIVLVIAAAPAAQAPDDNRLLSLFADFRQKPGITPDAEKRIQAVIGSIPSMTTAEVAGAIPEIMAVLSTDNEPVQGVAALACFAIVRRPDGSQLLAKEFPVVASLFQAQSLRLGELAGLILLNARTPLGPEVMSRIVAAIGQRSRSGAERIPALATAVGMAPADPAVVEAVVGFMLEPLDASTKAAVLTAIRVSRVDAAPVRLETIAWLQDSDARVKLSAISVLTRMGSVAVADARFELERIAQRETEPAEVRGAAVKALQMLR